MTRLLQTLRHAGGICVSFFVLLTGCSSSSPVVTEPAADGAATVVGAAPAPVAPTPRTLEPLALDAARVPATFAPPDVLQRLRDGFVLPVEDNPRVSRELDWFVRHPDYLERVFTRAQRYLPHITAELDRRGLPLELALLPVVESAYDPFAYSHGRAAGLWQMIPGTATRFGIKQNWWYDGRRDIVDSTRAALEYFEHLYEFNEGNWLNAIASYNSGEGNVRKAVMRNRANNKPDDFFSLDLSRETTTYVPRLLALVEIVRNPQQYGLSLPHIVDAPQFVVTDIESQLDLALAAELAGVDVDTVYAFNPGYNRWSTDPQGPHSLVLPYDVAADFSAALEQVPVQERVRWQRHKVKNGETISGIAQRYHTTIPSIRSANNLRGNTIRAGDYLMIPMASKPLTAYSQSADARLAKTQSKPRADNKVDHIVASGESFWSIGQRYGVSTRELSAWNGMAPGDTLPVGRKLVVWTDADVAPRGAAIGGPTTAPANTTRKLNYTVRSGDSLYLIANRFRVTVAELTRWNNIDKNKILRPGQQLTMYVDVTRQSS